MNPQTRVNEAQMARMTTRSALDEAAARLAKSRKSVTDAEWLSKREQELRTAWDRHMAAQAEVDAAYRALYTGFQPTEQ